MAKVTHDLLLIVNQRLSEAYHLLVFKSSVPIPEVFPGQFAEILVPDAPKTFLRRPFSIYDADYNERTIKFIIKIAGDGTQRLCNLAEGSVVNIIYPIGHGFSLAEGRSLIVGGGVGIAPMYLLAKWLKQNHKDFDILIGGRSESDIINLAEFSGLGETGVTTEDGSLGHKGLVTHHPWMQDPNQRYNRIYTCGPEPMMKAISRIASKSGISCEVSLENTMACGFGVCLCCIVATDEGNVCVCTEGPVFNTKKLIGWE
jgi:dihydroorotate dehydrogenase electron transfer subunit